MPTCKSRIVIEVPCGALETYGDDTYSKWCILESGHDCPHEVDAPTDKPAKLVWEGK